MYEVVRSGVPRLPQGLLARPHLQELLTVDGPVRVVYGPAGSGKTTAIAQWALSADGPVAWVTMNKEMQSRTSIWHHILSAVMGSGGFTAAPGFDPDQLLNSTEGLVERLMEFFAAGPSMTLVIDGAHMVKADIVFDDLVEIILGRALLQVVVSSRTILPLLGARTAARVDVATVPPSALALQPDETAQILHQAGLPVDQVMAKAVHEAAGGSIFAARLITAGLSRADQRHLDVELASLTNAGADYLREFLSQMPAGDELLEFMLATATAESLPASLARKLAPESDPKSLLALIEEVGAGMGGHFDSSGAFIYTPLLRQGLRSKLQATRPAEYRQLRTVVAAWEATHGDPFVAFDVALEVDDLALATEIAKQTWLDILRFNVPGIIRATSRLKVWQLHRYPVLAMLIALAHNTQAPGRFKAVEHFAVAAVGARVHQRGLSTPDRIILATLEGSALRVTGRLDRALAPAEKAINLLNEAPQQAAANLGQFLPAILANNGLTLLAHQRFPEALRIFEQASTAAAWSSRPRAPFHPLALRAGTMAMSGDLRQARELINFPHDDTWPARERGTYLATFYHVARTVLYLEDFNFQAARIEIELLKPELPTNEHRGLLLLLGSVTIAAEGDPLRAAHRLQEAQVEEPGLRRISAPDAAHLQATSALLFNLAHRHDLAKACLESIPKRWIGRTRLTTALIAIRQNDNKGAQHLLQLPQEGTSTRRAKARQELLKAIVCLRAGRHDMATSHLRAASVTLTENHMRLPLLFLPSADLAELRKQAADPELELLLARGVPTPNSLQQSKARLTPREKIVLGYLAEYLTAPQIATQLGVSVHTVKSQMNGAYRKLGARTREQALIEATRQGLIPDSSMRER